MSPNVPFVTTPRAKGLVSENHPRSLRNGGMAASQWARRYTAEPVDACLVLGTDLDDTSMGPTRYAGPDAHVVHVDIEMPAQLLDAIVGYGVSHKNALALGAHPFTLAPR